MQGDRLTGAEINKLNRGQYVAYEKQRTLWSNYLKVERKGFADEATLRLMEIQCNKATAEWNKIKP